jgi:hypothetical protein
MKYRAIDEAVGELFEKAIKNAETVHDRDLQEWALVEATKCGFHAFKASTKWLHVFKRRHRIVGRKITKQRTRKTHVDQQKLEQSIEDFQQKLAPILEATNASNVCFRESLSLNLDNQV